MTRRYAVVGAGVAGLVAADTLRRAGHDAVVLERTRHVGGRTRTVRWSDDHLLDTGAAWLASFYGRALGYAAGIPLLPRDVAGTPRLRLTGRPGTPVVPAPFGPVDVARSRLLTWPEKTRLVAWVLAHAARGAPVGPRNGGERDDDVDAARFATARLGVGVLEAILRPAFETMVFSPVDELSAAFVGNWAGAALTARYRVPADGMDAPWRRLAGGLAVRTGREVLRVEPADPVSDTSLTAGGRHPQGPGPTASGVVVTHVGADGQQHRETFDGVVVAVPAPVAAQLVDPGTLAEPGTGWSAGRPPWLDDVRYAEHVFAYGARRCRNAPPASDIHPAGRGAHRVGSVQLQPGGNGRVPRGRQGAVVSATGPWSAELLRREAGDDELFDLLWRDGLVLEPALFPASACEVRHVVRWRHAVPVFGPGHLTRLATWRPSAPIALAGDWAWYPCIEGAVVSGERAAAALLRAA